MVRWPLKYICFVLAVFLIVLCVFAPGCHCGDEDDDDDGGGVETDDDDSASDDHPPVIENTTRLSETQDYAGPYKVYADVYDDNGLESVSLFYRVGMSDFSKTPMTQTAEASQFVGEIPGQFPGSSVQYYVQAKDTASQITTDPETAPSNYYEFSILQPYEIKYDDGTSEISYGVIEYGSFVFVRFTPETYPAYLTGFEWYCGTILRIGEIQPYVIYEETGNQIPPDIWNAFPVGEPFVPTTFDGWETIDLSEAPMLQAPLASGDFYVGFKNTYRTELDHVHFGWDYSSIFINDRSWYWYSATGQWYNQNDSVQGIYMFRIHIIAP